MILFSRRRHWTTRERVRLAAARALHGTAERAPHPLASLLADLACRVAPSWPREDGL